MAHFNKETSLFSEEYNTHRVIQSEAPLKYILSSAREGIRNEHAKRTVHINSFTGVDRPILTNKNDLFTDSTELVGMNPLRTRHVFGKETDVNTRLRPQSARVSPTEASWDLFNPGLQGIRVPTESFVRGGASTRADARNEYLN